MKHDTLTHKQRRMDQSRSYECETTMERCGDEALHRLSYQQVNRLTEVVSETLQLFPKAGTGSFPPLPISPSRLIKAVRGRLDHKGIRVRDVRLNGSAASYCLANEREKEPKPHYNDLDVIFRLDLRSDVELHVVKDEVLNSLYEFFPEGISTERITGFMLEESYVKKMVKVTGSTDRWSLIALGDEVGKNIELKFVGSMKRQYEFSVDSFQIILDSLMFMDKVKQEGSPVKIDPDFYPTVYATSLYGEFEEALTHLNHRLISTRNPEEIRGGGLLKYCCLQVIGYKPAYPEIMESHEPYMCSRFFIDFPSAHSQLTKIQKYLFTRFIQPGQLVNGAEFLNVLMGVVSKQARCLMESERQKTLAIIQQIQLWHFPMLCNPIPFYSMPPAVRRPSWQQQHHHNPHYHHHNHRHHHHYSHSRQHSPQFGAPRRRANSNSSNDSDHLSSPPPQPHLFFPHTSNNTVPVGPSPTSVW